MKLPQIRFLFLTLLLSLCACTPKSTESVAGKVTGYVKISPELQAKLKPSDILFIIARDQQTGPPSAVKRIVHPVFPLKYMIGPEDAMIPGTPGFEYGAELTITARISRTGNAKPAPGDIEGVYKNNPTSPGTGGVDIVLDHERTD